MNNNWIYVLLVVGYAGIGVLMSAITFHLLYKKAPDPLFGGFVALVWPILALGVAVGVVVGVLMFVIMMLGGLVHAVTVAVRRPQGNGKVIEFPRDDEVGH